MSGPPINLRSRWICGIYPRQIIPTRQVPPTNQRPTQILVPTVDTDQSRPHFFFHRRARNLFFVCATKPKCFKQLKPVFPKKKCNDDKRATTTRAPTTPLHRPQAAPLTRGPRASPSFPGSPHPKKKIRKFIPIYHKTPTKKRIF